MNVFQLFFLCSTIVTSGEHVRRVAKGRILGFQEVAKSRSKNRNVFVATRHATIPPSFGTAQNRQIQTLPHHTDVAMGSIMQITSSFLYSKMFDCPISSQLLAKVRHSFDETFNQFSFFGFFLFKRKFSFSGNESREEGTSRMNLVRVFYL